VINLEKTILVADDNDEIVKILDTYLKREGFNPINAYDGEDAIKKFKQFNPQLILLDIMMPKIDGYKVCKEIRKQSNTPIIMITAKGEDVDKIMGLDLGADDYVVKPFSPREIIARINAVLRRITVNDIQKSTILKFNNLQINIGKYEVTINNEPMDLTKKEIEILWLLASNLDKAFSRNELLDSIWGEDYVGDSRTVDTHIKRLRAKLNVQDSFGWDIKTVWGTGYRFEVKDV
jgi:Response regulators consisting of a CheY-like receiver domain and a winged-helix DNA-binding domain